jgi:hypothetical protein
VVVQGLGRLADEHLMSGAMAASQRHTAILSASLMFVLFSGAIVPSAQVMCGDIIALGGTCLVTADLRLLQSGTSMLPKPNQVAGINISMSKHHSGSYWIFEALIHQTAENISWEEI